MDGAQGVLLSIAGGSDLGLFEINEAASLVQEAAHPEANIIFGTVIDDSLGDEVRVTVIAAGFEAGTPDAQEAGAQAYGTRSGGVVAAGVSGTTAAPQNGHGANGATGTRHGAGATSRNGGTAARSAAVQRGHTATRAQRRAQPVPPAAVGQAPTPRTAPPPRTPRATARRPRPPASATARTHGACRPAPAAREPAARGLHAARPAPPRARRGAASPGRRTRRPPRTARRRRATRRRSSRSDFDDDVDVPSFMKR